MLRVGVARVGRLLAPSYSRSLHTTPVLSAIQLNMPSLSPTMEEGTIVKWHKAPGDALAEGDVVCDIQTDKAVMSMEATEEGTMAKVMTEENLTVKVGTLIALLAEDGEEWQEVAAAGVTAEAPPSSGDTAAAPAAASGGSTPGVVVNMPSLSPTMEEGTIVKWYKAEGEAIAAGDVLCDIQTDKAVVAMEADEDGVVAKILVGEGEAAVKVGQLIALLVEEGQDWNDVSIPGASAPPPTPTPSSTPTIPSSPMATSGQPMTAAVQDFVHPTQTGPAAALLLTQYNINPANVPGSGPKSNITKTDVMDYIKAQALPVPAPAAVPLPGRPAKPAAVVAAAPPPPRPTGGHTDVELTSMRRVIARRLTESKQTAPHGYSSATSDITAVSRLRKDYVRSGFKVSINDFVIKAAAAALQYVPEINSNVVNEELVPQAGVDISVAVATPAGLITPIVRDAAGKPVHQISAEVKELAGRARENKLKLDEFQGGTFTISNLGMFGIAEFTAIINAPQVAILAVGGGREVIHPDTLRATTVMTATLSFDRRYIDEAAAADFMAVFQRMMERPEMVGAGYLGVNRVDRAAAALP